MAARENIFHILTVLIWILKINTILCSNKDLPWKKEYDYIIVGGGTAGCVVATRLSEDRDVNVLLIEAGPDPANDQLVKIPRAFSRFPYTEEYDWGFTMEPQDKTERILRVNQAKMLGGGSSHNAMNVIRGSSHDFNKWSKLGNKGWSYKEVLKYFKKSEDMMDDRLAKNGYHGVGGPWQTRLADRHPIIDVILKNAKKLGYKVTDINGPSDNGFSRSQNNVGRDGRRMSTAEAFLRPVMSRWNLDVILEAQVTKIDFSKCKNTESKCKPRAKGVFFVKNEEEYYVSSKEIIVSAGAINSPKLLMLSGIGDQLRLELLDIDVIADLPVGENLMDHIFVPMWFVFKPPVPLKKKIIKVHDLKSFVQYVFKGTGPWSTYVNEATTYLKTRTQPKEDKFPYIELSMGVDVFGMSREMVENLSNNETLDDKLIKYLEDYDKRVKYIGTGPLLLHPRYNGRITLKSKDPFQPPKIKRQYFEHPYDMSDLIEVIEISKGVFFWVGSDQIDKDQQYVRGIRGAMSIQKFMNTSYMLLNVGVEAFNFVDEVCWLEDFNSYSWWECYMLNAADSSYGHFSSTCKMAPDHTGVVDNKLRVKGVSGLRVIDSSIMPMIVSGHPMAATIMIAEKGSDMIKEERQLKRNKKIRSEEL